MPNVGDTSGQRPVTGEATVRLVGQCRLGSYVQVSTVLSACSAKEWAGFYLIWIVKWRSIAGIG